MLPPKRVKRDLSSLNEKSDEEKYILNGKQINEAKDMIMGYNVPCSQDNTMEICKDLVTKLQSIGDNKNANNFHNNNKEPIERDTEELTSTEKSKRQTRPLENIEMIRSAPYYGKESYAYDNRGSMHSYPQHLHTSPMVDSCLLARILKQNFQSDHRKCFFYIM